MELGDFARWSRSVAITLPPDDILRQSPKVSDTGTSPSPTTIVTRNLPDYRKSPVPAISAADILRMPENAVS